MTTAKITTLGELGVGTATADGFTANPGWAFTDDLSFTESLATQVTFYLCGLDPQRAGTFVGYFDNENDDKPSRLYATYMPEGMTETVPSEDTQVVQLV